MIARMATRAGYFLLAHLALIAAVLALARAAG